MSLVTNADIDEAKRRLTKECGGHEPYALAVYPKATEVALERVSADLEDNAQEVMRLQGELSAARAELAACGQMFCAIMAEAIRGRADAAIVKQRKYDGEDSLAAVSNLANDHIAARTELAAIQKDYAEAIYSLNRCRLLLLPQVGPGRNDEVRTALLGVVAILSSPRAREVLEVMP